MGDFSDDFLILEQNVQQLTQNKGETEGELKILKVELEGLKAKTALQEKEIEELIEKNKILRIAGGAKGKEGSKEIKLKINEIVREVDKCIAQLNQ